jgi:hypothetical protein
MEPTDSKLKIESVHSPQLQITAIRGFTAICAQVKNYKHKTIEQPNKDEAESVIQSYWWHNQH